MVSPVGRSGSGSGPNESLGSRRAINLTQAMTHLTISPRLDRRDLHVENQERHRDGELPVTERLDACLVQFRPRSVIVANSFSS